MNETDIRTKGDQEDLKLVRKVKKGYQKEFNKLVLKYQKRIYFTVRKMVVNHEDTNDIVQDTFVKAYTHLDQFDEHYPFYPWLHRIALNTAINHQKKKIRRKENSIENTEESVYKPEATNGNPLKTVEKHEMQEHLAHAMKQLPFHQRAVFVMRVSEQMSYQEISEQLDISIGTVMSRLSRARETMKQSLHSLLSVKD